MRSRLGFVLACLLSGVYAFGQPYPQQPSAPEFNQSEGPQGQAADQIDPEDRSHGVARIGLLNGDVSVRRGDSGDQVAAAINAPLLAPDALVVGPASRAEIQFDTANRVRLASDTEVRLSVLTADHFQIQIARGTMTWAVLGEGSAQGEVATPSIAVHPLGRGSYRISVLPDGTTQVTVRSGALEVSTPRGVERLSAGQSMLARGPVENPEFQTVGAIGRDEWDTFNDRRDQELQQSQSYNYVSRDIAGAEDLDNYGQWNSDQTYGQVWTPRVAADWSPYRLGRWGYEDYYGWTWISYDPWGWAPYHYGSWFRGVYGWSWYPGSRYSHYYYRPAQVAFFGFGGGVNVGWVPLAPYERYNRWYGHGVGGYGAFGRTVNVVGIYRNARVGNGVTALNSRDFAAGHFGRYTSPGTSQLQQASFARGGVPFGPTNNHLRFNDRQTVVQSRSNFSQTRFASGNVPRQNFQSQPQTNWQRFGSPVQQNFSNSRPATGRTSQGGSSTWQQFGNPGSTRQNYSPSNTSRGYSQSVQVAPPVIRERQQPAYNQPQRNTAQPSRSSQPTHQSSSSHESSSHSKR